MEVLASRHFDSENCIQSVILESELTVVVEKRYVYTPGSLFSNTHCAFGMKRISPLSSVFCTRKDKKLRSKQSGVGTKSGTEKAGEPRCQ